MTDLAKRVALVSRLKECDPSVHLQEEAAERLETLEREVQRCHERLEIDHVWQMEEGGKVRVDVPMEERHGIPDGIECRNETIKLLDRNIATLRANAAAAELALTTSPRDAGERLTEDAMVDLIEANTGVGTDGLRLCVVGSRLAARAIIARLTQKEPTNG